MPPSTLAYAPSSAMINQFMSQNPENTNKGPSDERAAKINENAKISSMLNEEIQKAQAKNKKACVKNMEMSA